MELVRVNTKSHQVLVAPIGDLQWSGARGPTAQTHVKDHIKEALDRGAFFLGMGDYIDFLSPSNRMRLTAAALYDTADNVIDEKVHELVQEVFDTLLTPTKGRWIGLLEGHHFYEGQGSTSDMWLAEMLECPFLGTSNFVRLDPSGFVIYAHHGTGGGQLPAAPFNKLYHTSHGWIGADVYMMGHTTKMGAVRISRPLPDWNAGENGRPHSLTHNDILLVSTGGFSKSSIVGHRHGRIPRGDYAEQRMLTPSPLSAPFVRFRGPRGKYVDGIRAEV